MTSRKNKRPEWAIIRIPRKLYMRIREGQGTTLHETIERAMNAFEDPKAEARLKVLRAELAAAREELAKAEGQLMRLRGAVAMGKPSAAARTVPMFAEPKVFEGEPRVTAVHTIGVPPAMREKIVAAAIAAVRHPRAVRQIAAAIRLMPFSTGGGPQGTDSGPGTRAQKRKRSPGVSKAGGANGSGPRKGGSHGHG